MTPRFPILLALLAVLSSLGISRASQPTSDAIFAKLYCRYLARACSPDLQKVVGVNLADYPQKGGIPQRDLDRLSVDDKCLLALFWGLSLPLDGEKAELFGTFLGKDRVKVARRLQKIPEADLRNLCAGMGYPEGRASYLSKQIAIWLDPKMSVWFRSEGIVSPQSDGAAGASEPTSDAIFAKLYCRYLASSCTPTIEKALGKNLSHYPKGEISWGDVNRLSVDDKCLLALFWGLSLPLDGETAETFGDFLAKDRVKVARRLQKIPEADLRNLCAGMRYPEGRASYLSRQIARWLDPKLSGWFDGTKNP